MSSDREVLCSLHKLGALEIEQIKQETSYKPVKLILQVRQWFRKCLWEPPSAKYFEINCGQEAQTIRY